MASVVMASVVMALCSCGLCSYGTYRSTVQRAAAYTMSTHVSVLMSTRRAECADHGVAALQHATVLGRLPRHREPRVHGGLHRRDGGQDTAAGPVGHIGGGDIIVIITNMAVKILPQVP